MNLDNVLESAFRIRPGEARRVGLMFTYLMGVVSTFIVGRTVRDTLFLSRYDLSYLPLMYIAVAVFVAMASYAYSRFADRYRRDAIITASISIFAVVVALFWGMLRLKLAGDWLYPALYVVVEIVGAISIIQFWTFANDIYSSREAKRLFGVIGAGGVLSNITCGFAIGWVVPLIGSENLLLVCVALLGLCIASVRAIARIAESDLEEAVQKPKKSRIAMAADSGTVLGSRHLKIIAGIVAVTFLSVSIIDYQFKVIAKGTYSEAQLASFFGYFYGFTGIISSLLQFFGTSRLLERRGIVVSLSLLPIGLLVGVGAMFLPMVRPLVAATTAKAAENIFRYTVNDASTQLLYVPVPSHYRGRAKAFIDGILKPVSIGIAGVLLLMLGRVIPKDVFAVRLAYLDLVMLAAWLVMVVAIRREYVKSLISTLHSRRLDFSTTWHPIQDDSTVRALKRSLASPREEEVLHSLELVSVTDADFRAEVCALLQHASKKVRIQALKLTSAMNLEDISPVQALLSDPDGEIRAAAIRAFCAIGREKSIREAAPFLTDGNPRVRASAVVALIKHGGLDGVLTAAESLKSFLTSEDAELRLEGAHVLGEIKVKNFFHPLLGLLRDSDPRVRAAAVDAAGAMQSPELLGALIATLGSPETHQLAVRALVAYGPGIERELFLVLENPGERLEIRRSIPRILSQIGGQDAVSGLMRLLGGEGMHDPELRGAIAKAASKIRQRVPRTQINDLLLDTAIKNELHDAYQILGIIEDLALPKTDLLPDALFVRHRAKLGLAFRLLEIRYPAKTIQTVYSNLDAESKAVRANALEVVDNVLSKDESRLLLPLLEDTTRAEKVRRGEELFAIERRPSDGWLATLLEDPHPWIVSCTLQLAGDRKRTELMDAIAKHLKSKDPIVRETACLTLARLLRGNGHEGRDELLRLAAEVATDNTPEVRRASTSLLAALEA